MLNNPLLPFPIILLCLPSAFSQEPPAPPDQIAAEQKWNLHYQATSIGQRHGFFHAPYRGPLSLQNYPEHVVSLTTTLFFGVRLDHNTQLYFDPEIAGGRGFSGVNGIANAPNGELPRVATATPKPYLARLYISHDFGFGSEKEHVEGDANQLGGERPMTRYTVAAGRFSLTDFFDNNTYTHDPRTQFMAWGVMYNGAWDYPADTRGYTWGMVHEFHTRHWSLRYGSAAEPKKANGSRFDRRLLRDRGDVFEGERRYSFGDHPGAVRLLVYLNHTDSGSYGDALRLAAETGTTPAVTATHRPGTLKYGTGLNLEQEIARGVGFFTRLGWSDGKTQDFAFTAIDRLASGGVSIKGTRWKRKDDVAATSFTASGLSGVHALYLSRGGLDFLIGDGRLNYAPEYVWETYYSAQLFPGFFATFDLQRVANPAYNHDRGPVWIESIRLHMEFGLHPLQAK
ncbi:MAG: Carbohydrate-selective porin OprB [Bryobacterales bacterium]|nr:Carbohydrate-selective porin OprB [Bryobacterales bacterium]